jgi:hypothetical protein
MSFFIQKNSLFAISFAQRIRCDRPQQTLSGEGGRLINGCEPTKVTHLNNPDTDNLVVMQYTDLKDKNGKEIYEGDVYEMSGFPNDEGQMQMEKHEVKWPEFLIDWYSPKDKQLDIEIIGNIYENPELLK